MAKQEFHVSYYFLNHLNNHILSFIPWLLGIITLDVILFLEFSPNDKRVIK